ncbi:MAG: Fe-S cluster assembly protein SufD [Acidimicrobiales bacterium]|nr:Fe-S cluster assembly protein SufD [Acidimicrobiales bacterium]
MTTGGTLLERLVPADTSGGDGSDRGREWLNAHGLPTGREEAWLYTPVSEIVAALDEAELPAAPGSAPVEGELIDRLAGSHGGPRLVVVNGVFVPDLSDLGAGIDGLRLSGPSTQDGSRTQFDPTDGFQALNWAAGTEVTVTTDPDARIEVPVHVVHVTVPGEGVTLTNPRTLLTVGARSHVHLIETFVGVDGRAVTNATTRIVAGEDSSVVYDQEAAEPADAIHVGRVGIEQQARSTVKATTLVTGGHIVRNAVDVAILGDGATSDLGGLYLPTGKQRHDNVITVDHAASHATSTQQFRGIVDDHGRGSFSGHVIVRHGTVGTDADQSNPNLVLSPTAQADTRPWLEIFADDVKCAHGATVGRLDEEAAFYMRSRGVPAAQARTMLVAAFAVDVLDRLSVASLRERVAAVVEDRTGGASR